MITIRHVAVSAAVLQLFGAFLLWWGFTLRSAMPMWDEGEEGTEIPYVGVRVYRERPWAIKLGLVFLFLGMLLQVWAALLLPSECPNK